MLSPRCRTCGGIRAVHRTRDACAERGTHRPEAAGKVFDLVKPRMAGLWHTPILSAQVIPMIFAGIRTRYQGAVVQTQDLTVFNVTKEAVVVRQAKVEEALHSFRRADQTLHPDGRPTSVVVGRGADAAGLMRGLAGGVQRGRGGQRI